MKGRFYSYLLWQVFLDMNILGLYLPSLSSLCGHFQPLKWRSQKAKVCKPKVSGKKSPNVDASASVTSYSLLVCWHKFWSCWLLWSFLSASVGWPKVGLCFQVKCSPCFLFFVLFLDFFRPCFQAKCTPWISSRGVGEQQFRLYSRANSISSAVREAPLKLARKAFGYCP